MKYYLYISDTKVDMLYSQIPKNLRDQLSTELKINLKIISTKLSQKSREENRFSKLDIVTKYLEDHEEVGSIDLPGPYFSGVLPMSFVLLAHDAVYFTGQTMYSITVLGGSRKHVVGERTEFSEPSLDQFGMSPRLQKMIELISRTFSKEKAVEEAIYDRPETARLFASFHEVCPKPIQKMEFLAKKMFEGYEPKLRKRIVVGSPIYVCLAE